MSPEPLSLDPGQFASAFPQLNLEPEPLGDRGGQKHVFRTTHSEYGVIALKLIDISNGSREPRALRELDATKRLTGPHFARLFEHGYSTVGEHQVLYIMEEFLDGGSLRSRLRATDQMGVGEVLGLFEELLVALQMVDANGLVHRDIKPENIMLPPRRVVLIDFGIARHLGMLSLTQDDAPFGPLTVGYAAPEQIRNEKRSISIRTDLFALGVVVYESLAGYNPYLQGCSTRNEAFDRALRFTPEPLTAMVPEVPAELSELVERCLEKAIHRRPPSPGEVLADVRAIRAAITGTEGG